MIYQNESGSFGFSNDQIYKQKHQKQKKLMNNDVVSYISDVQK